MTGKMGSKKMTYDAGSESNPQCQSTWYLSQPAEPATFFGRCLCYNSLALIKYVCDVYVCWSNDKSGCGLGAGMTIVSGFTVCILAYFVYKYCM